MLVVFGERISDGLILPVLTSRYDGTSLASNDLRFSGSPAQLRIKTLTGERCTRLFQ